MARDQPCPAHPAGQQGLDPAGLLLRAEPKHREDRVRRGRDARDAETGCDVGVGQGRAARRAGPGGRASTCCRRRTSPCSRPATPPGARAPRNPPPTRPAPPRCSRQASPSGPASRGPRPGRPRPGAEQCSAQVAPIPQLPGGQGRPRCGHQGQGQHPPVRLCGVRLESLDPPDRGEPGQPRHARLTVGDGPDGVRRTEHATGQAGRRPPGATDLAGHGSHRREHETRCGERQARSDRTDTAGPGGREAQRDQHAEAQRRHDGQPQAGHQRGEPPDCAGTDQLGQPGLLLGPGVPHDGEDREQPGQHEREPARLPHDDAADRVQLRCRAVEREGRRGSPGWCGPAAPARRWVG